MLIFIVLIILWSVFTERNIVETTFIGIIVVAFFGREKASELLVGGIEYVLNYEVLFASLALYYVFPIAIFKCIIQFPFINTGRPHSNMGSFTCVPCMALPLHLPVFAQWHLQASVLTSPEYFPCFADNNAVYDIN